MSAALVLPAAQAFVIALPLALGAGLIAALILAWPRSPKR